MGKKKDKRKRRDERQSAPETPKNLEAHRVRAVALSTWMGDEFTAERNAIKNAVRLLHKLPYMETSAGVGGDFANADFSPEEVAMAFARCHMRLQHLLGAWVSAGFIAEDAPTMRVVRTDMRVLAEMHLTMMRELAALGVKDGVTQ